MERIRYFNVETLSDLSKVKFSGDPGDATYFTYSDTTLRQGAPDVVWHGVCTVAPVGQVYSHGKFYFPGRSGYSGTVYGVQWDTTDPSPECTRIGNLSLHATLPVQGKMVGGLMLDDGTFNEFGDQSDWTSYTRDGSLGQVMVRIPTFWIKFETWGDMYKVLMSAVPVVGFTMVKEMYVSAYEASLDRTDLKLSSVVNTSARYRGGNDNSSWDAEDTAGEGGESHRSLLGRPATGISLTEFRTYARKRGSTAWNCHFYLMQKTLYWLYVVEYATLNSQKAFNAALDANGFHQGGLGDGVSTWNDTSWSDFNDNLPFILCGWTDSLGNSSGVRNYTVYDATGTALKTLSVPRYRGIENPWGHIWKHTDGILCQVNSGDDGVSQVYATDDPAEFSSTSYSSYRLAGNELRVQQYVSQLHLGVDGDITAKAGGGNSTSYYCDYHYCDVGNTGLRVVLFGSTTNAGAACGFVSSNSSQAPSLTYAMVGSRLCYFDAWKDVVYEEHEWLKGDGSAYIDTDIIVDVPSLYISTSFTKKIGGQTPLFGSRDDINSSGSQIWYLNSGRLRLDIITNTSNWIYIESSNVQDVNQLIVDCPNKVVNINGISVPSGVDSLSIKNSSNTFKIYSLELLNTPGGYDNVPYNGAFGNFTLNDSTHSLHLTPCRLLRPIPASLDANGIARDAGECGMWDKVGNKFYGNVASTGKFTVEGQRLYEEFDWLCGNGTAYFRIPVNIYQESLYVKFHPISSDSNHEFWVGFYNVSSDATIEIRGMAGGSNELGIRFGIRENSAATANVLNARNVDFLNDFTVETRYSEDNKVNFTYNGTSGTATPKIDSRANVNVSVEFRTTWCRFAMVTTDRLNLTPVRLLRPLPAYMDANGKSRAAGECGMWDKVSNKFYGNVASSGRFTVLNN